MLSIEEFLVSNGEDFELMRNDQNLGIIRGLMNTEKST